ncbi:zinc transporter 1 [Siniperca chuatsi]|uniref:zinc transporter 1 n=1 Tax=Siniperca chuatsi TaxID=119488 RepID=UPI001CE05D0B|nr:zinc transporter 1 [Siniperca chuatsi]XP_044059964.1 zinc transporter 1 [Siniperca chuatsi]
MRVLHWCMLGVTILLVVCEVTISQLCKSLITLVDGFHTLFILMRMALPPPTASIIKPPLSSLDSASPPHASSSSAALPSTLPTESSIEPLPGTQTATDGPTIPDQPPTPQPHLEAVSLVNSHQLFSPKTSPAALDCGLSYTTSRIQAVGTFISALVLACLCLSHIMEIISFSLEPHPVQRPLLLVVVGAVSLLHKMLVLWLNWDQLQDERAGRRPETKTHLEVNHKVLAEEETKGQAESGRVLDDVSRVQSAVDNSLHNGALVLCNPGTSSVPDTDPQTPQQQPEVHLHAAAPQDSRNCEVASGVADLSHSEDITELSKDKTCMGHLDSQNASNTSPVCKSSHHIESPVPSSQGPVRPLLLVPVIQGLCTSLLALTNNLVMLLIGPQCLHSSGACGFLVYLDPGLSLLAVITLIATATPQVHRFGLLLLQATPPHICVSDLGRRIASVPGVQAVHDLHVWQLTESFIVASVHVHCHAGFPAHRCADLMSGVTKVLQSVGVSCCTVQPEFASCSGCSAGSGGGDASPVVHREDPSLPPLLACSLACGKACAGNMCCTPLGEELRSLLAPPAGETKEEPQTLVIENTFL